uniref:Tropinone reductase-like 3 n=1 Tax=Leersia perrieri TaxID=77586 RepID=A0A0D9XB49_9ORYZ
MEVKCRRLEGKVAVVTASTQGIGLAIAQRLGLEGAAVLISSRKKKNVDEAVDALRAKGITVVGAVCHVSDADQRKNLIDTAVKNFGHIDIIVSNAAANPSLDSILQMKESVLDKLWDINVKASILLVQDAAAHLRKGSSVIIISSIAGYNPEGALSMYGVTKTALLGLTKALAAEMGPNTRVNCIAPGFVPTRFAGFLTTNETVKNELIDRSMLKKLGTVEDMGAAAAFLASDDASYITGETIVVAGGTHSRL